MPPHQFARAALERAIVPPLRSIMLNGDFLERRRHAVVAGEAACACGAPVPAREVEIED